MPLSELATRIFNDLTPVRFSTRAGRFAANNCFSQNLILDNSVPVHNEELKTDLVQNGRIERRQIEHEGFIVNGRQSSLFHMRFFSSPVFVRYTAGTASHMDQLAL